MAELGATKLVSYSDDQTVFLRGDHIDGLSMFCSKEALPDNPVSEPTIGTGASVALKAKCNMR